MLATGIKGLITTIKSISLPETFMAITAGLYKLMGSLGLVTVSEATVTAGAGAM
jgi:hypothetical protein